MDAARQVRYDAAAAARELVDQSIDFSPIEWQIDDF